MINSRVPAEIMPCLRAWLTLASENPLVPLERKESYAVLVRAFESAPNDGGHYLIAYDEQHLFTLLQFLRGYVLVKGKRVLPRGFSKGMKNLVARWAKGEKRCLQKLYDGGIVGAIGSIDVDGPSG